MKVGVGAARQGELEWCCAYGQTAQQPQPLGTAVVTQPREGTGWEADWKGSKGLTLTDWSNWSTGEEWKNGPVLYVVGVPTGTLIPKGEGVTVATAVRLKVSQQQMEVQFRQQLPLSKTGRKNTRPGGMRAKLWIAVETK
eukprot:365427-Chlamydomonas_euryale.AAC.8